MAKGKHAVAAARGRYESAVEHIDRLTTELAEAKLRARTVERQARTAGDLELRVARLERDLADATSDRVRKLEADLATLQAGLAARGVEIVNLFHRLNETGAWTPEQWDRAFLLIGGPGIERLMVLHGVPPKTRTAVRNLRHQRKDWSRVVDEYFRTGKKRRVDVIPS